MRDSQEAKAKTSSPSKRQEQIALKSEHGPKLALFREALKGTNPTARHTTHWVPVPLFEQRPGPQRQQATKGSGQRHPPSGRRPIVARLRRAAAACMAARQV